MDTCADADRLSRFELLESAWDGDYENRSNVVDQLVRALRGSVERERTVVSDASHELRTPLAVVRTELELIGRERPAGPALQTAISSAIEETDRLSQLADDLLLLARADDHQLAIDPSRLPATEILNQAADRGRRQPNAAQKQITVEAPDDARSSPIKAVPPKPSTSSSPTPCATRTRASTSAHERRSECADRVAATTAAVAVSGWGTRDGEPGSDRSLSGCRRR